MKFIEFFANIILYDFVIYIKGTIGLFLGVSLLSFVELIEIFFDILFILFTYFYPNRKNNAEKQTH